MSEPSSRSAASRASRSALAILLLTSIHHAYGAWIYGTPWRLHAVFVAAATAAVIGGSLFVMRRQPSGIAEALASCAFALAVFVVPIALIGIFEGLYNHVLKNALYFGGASASVMRSLFPPPRYELPNDFFFELSGMMQGVLAIVATWRWIGFLRSRVWSLAA